MLVTFSSAVSPDVVLFGEVATLFLKAMGENEKPPGILRGENIRLAMQRLQSWLSAVPANDADEDDDSSSDQDKKPDRQSRVGLGTRALPLLELMDAAYKKQSDVIWR